MTNLEALKKFAAATNNELFDTEDGEWMVDAVQTYETLEQWEKSSTGWNEHTTMNSGSISGLPFRAWRSAQVCKGQTRRSISIIDLGDVRYALHGVDLTYFE